MSALLSDIAITQAGLKVENETSWCTGWHVLHTVHGPTARRTTPAGFSPGLLPCLLMPTGVFMSQPDWLLLTLALSNIHKLGQELNPLQPLVGDHNKGYSTYLP